MNLILSIISQTIKITFNVICGILPALLVYAALLQPDIALNRGAPVIHYADHTVVHELFPQSTWDDLEPCGKHFNEKEEFQRAMSCVDKNVWPESPLAVMSLNIPRCFILKAQSPNVFTNPKMGFNFIPMFGLDGMGGVVGVYQPETHTVFVVENIDAPKIYRHELQHYFLHAHDPETMGGGHDQEIWKKCEPPYYTPSEEVTKRLPKPTSGE